MRRMIDAPQPRPDEAALIALKAEADRLFADVRAARPWVVFWYEELCDVEFVAAVRRNLSDDDALAIREIRSDETFRGVASWCEARYVHTWDVSWSMTGHQAVGELICAAAALQLKEDPASEPWWGQVPSHGAGCPNQAGS